MCCGGLTFMAYYNFRYFRKIAIDPEKSLGKGISKKGISHTKPIQEYHITFIN